MNNCRTLVTAIAPLRVVAGVFVLVASAARSPIRSIRPEKATESVVDSADRESIVHRIDRLFSDRWHEAGLEPAVPTDDLTLYRRLSLVLLGTVPSLEEIRLFESDGSPDRIDRWTDQMLSDRRFADYFARRFSRFFVGADEGQFLGVVGQPVS